MPGIHVSRLPSNVTDKHLKVYFSNPRNGGGHVEKIYHPLPHGSAVVFFEDINVVDGLIKGTHQIMNTPIEVGPLPKQVFRHVTAEVEGHVSKFLSLNPQVVDELQFIGDVHVNFEYGKETYVLDGSWYQIEWALQYLDTMLDAFGFESEDGPPTYVREGGTAGNKQTASGAVRNSKAPPPPAEVKYQKPAPTNHAEIMHPNIPSIKPSETSDKYGRTQEGVSSIKSNKNKNKNVMPRSMNFGGTMGEPTEGFQQQVFENTLRRNTDDTEGRPPAAHKANKKNNLNADDSSDEEIPLKVDMGAYGAARRRNPYDYRGFDSDSENDDLVAGFDRSVNFAAGTNFVEGKGRPRPNRRPAHMPEMTRGLDIAQANFGEEHVALDFAFDMVGRIKVRVAMDDITRQTTDALVNPTNAAMSSQTGVSRAIVGAAGVELQLECRRYAEESGDLSVAEVMHTTAGGAISQKVGFVVHTVGPNWRESESESSAHMLVCTYLNCLLYADRKLWLQSLSLPLISAGPFGFPLDVCISAFFDALLLFSSSADDSLKLKFINLVCFDQDSAMAAIMIVRSLLDCEATQSSSAALDRYMTRKTNFSFKAELFTDMSGTGAKDQPSTNKEENTKDPEGVNVHTKKDDADDSDNGEDDEEEEEEDEKDKRDSDEEDDVKVHGREEIAKGKDKTKSSQFNEETEDNVERKLKQSKDSSEDEGDTDEDVSGVQEPVKQMKWEKFEEEEDDFENGGKASKPEKLDKKRNTLEEHNIRADEIVSDEDDERCPTDEEKRGIRVDDVNIGEKTDARNTEGRNNGGLGASSNDTERDEDDDDGDERGDADMNTKRSLATMDEPESFVRVSLEHNSAGSMETQRDGETRDNVETDI